MPHIPADLRNIRDRAHEQFLKGQVQISFSVLESELIGAAKSTGNHLYHQYALITLARQRMEMGEYVQADEALDEVAQITADHLAELIEQDRELYFYLQCKYFHIKGKNNAREYYFERSRATFEKGIQFVLSQVEPNEPELKIK